jgi:lactococcin 972 family bacteriocin
MKEKIRKIFVTVIVALFIGTAGVAVANATTDNVSGGTWKHWMDGVAPLGHTYSEYYHASKVHGSRVIALSTNTVCHGTKGHWTKAKSNRSPANNQVFYRVDNGCW